jgi:hypothetical protein
VLLLLTAVVSPAGHGGQSAGFFIESSFELLTQAARIRAAILSVLCTVQLSCANAIGRIYMGPGNQVKLLACGKLRTFNAKLFIEGAQLAFTWFPGSV